MRTFSSIYSDVTPSQWDSIRQEYEAGADGFGDRAKKVAPVLSDDDVAVIVAELDARAAARNGE